MSKIRIKNFGPIKEGFKETLSDGTVNEWLDVKKVTVFIGNQGSGKSTVAKVISTMSWIEKAINRGDYIENWTFNAFIEMFNYQNLKSYFKENTVIEYEGELYSIFFDKSKKWPIIKKKFSKNYIVPKIMYVPDSRNLLSVIKNATGVKGLPAPLFDFAEELKIGQINTNGNKVLLPINSVNYEYDMESDTSYIIGNDYKVNLLVASSGFQSLVPLFLVSSSLSYTIKNGSKISPANISVDQNIRMNNEISSIMLDNTLTDEDKLKKVAMVKAKFQNKAFINIVEEPEQNLFPTSQQRILYSLLEFNNMSEGNKLIMTTHSPYLINYLTLCVKAEIVKSKVKSEDSLNKLSKIVPLQSTVKAEDLVIYELNEMDGTINKLEDYKGLPSDDNELNSKLEDSNELFAQLQEIEKGWR